MKSIRRWALACGALLVLICGVAQAAPVLVAVEDDAAPWSRPDGTGYANDLVLAVFEAVGVAVELVRVPYARCKFMVMSGRSAGCFSMAWEPELNGKVVFADKPLFSSQVNFYVNAKEAVFASKISDVPKGTVIGVVNGFEYPAQVKDLSQHGGGLFLMVRVRMRPT